MKPEPLQVEGVVVAGAAVGVPLSVGTICSRSARAGAEGLRRCWTVGHVGEASRAARWCRPR